MTGKKLKGSKTQDGVSRRNVMGGTALAVGVGALATNGSSNGSGTKVKTTYTKTTTKAMPTRAPTSFQGLLFPHSSSPQ